MLSENARVFALFAETDDSFDYNIQIELSCIKLQLYDNKMLAVE